MRSRLRDERGAMLIQVGISILMLMAFMVFVLDNGILWVSRHQAQNAADAGALAGAVSRAFDDLGNPPAAGGPAETAAVTVANQNLVWNQAGTPVVSYGCPPWETRGGCVQVDVFRNGDNGSPRLPVVLGSLLGFTSQGVKATATAQALPANAARCLKPWAVADKWLESSGPWTQQSVYQPPADIYTPPYGTDGTGFSNKDANGDPVDWGLQLTLKLAHSGPAGTPGTLSSGWSMALDLPNDATPQYRQNISGCTSITVEIAPQAATCAVEDAQHGCIGVLTGGMVGQTNPGVDDIMALDSGAYWNTALRNGRGDIVTSFDAGSPRVVPVAVFDTGNYVAAGWNGTNGVVKVVNFLGFFIQGICSGNFYHEPYLDCSNNNNDVVGRLVTFPGTFIEGGTYGGPASFGMIIRLIR